MTASRAALALRHPPRGGGAPDGGGGRAPEGGGGGVRLGRGRGALWEARVEVRRDDLR